jgi:P4 family phage/plasmid primase-like protien
MIQLGGEKRVGYYTLDALQKEHQDYETKFITSFEYTNSGQRFFFVFDEFVEFIEILKNKKQSNDALYFHEFILGSSPFRMFFDIDCKEIHKITPLDLLSDFIDAFYKNINEYQINYPKDRISVCSAHTDKKHSFHIILPDLCVPDMHTMNIFAKNVKQTMEYGQYLDCSYHNNKNFRLPFNCKNGKTTPITFQPKWQYQNVLNDSIEDIEFHFEGNAHEMVKIFEVCLINCFFGMKYTIPSQINNTKKMITEELTDESLQEIYHLQKEKLIPEGLEIIEDQKTNFIVLKNKSGFNCPICNRRHEKDNAYLFKTPKGIYFKCFRNSEKSKLIKVCYQSPPNSYIHTYKEIIKDKFVDIIPKKSSKNTDVYMWNDENKLWEKIHNNIFCSKISNHIQNYSDEVLADLEKSKTKTIENMKKITEEIEELQKNKKRLTGNGRPRNENQESITDIKRKIKLKEEEHDMLKSSIKDWDSKIKAWTSFQKEASRTEYHLKIIEEIVSKVFSKNNISKLDKLQYHIPIKNGKVVNLRTQQILERQKDHYFTFESDIVYNPNVNKYAEEALFKIMCKDVQMLKFLKKALAYGCFGTNDQKKIFVFYGPQGHNGKSFVFTLMYLLLGPLFGDINQTLFKLGEAKANKPELLALEKKRFTQITELKKEDKMDITFLKTISGRDTINLRDNYSTSEEVKDITFDFIIYMMTNSFPDVVPDKALWARFLFFPFDAKFTQNDSEVNEESFIYKENPELIHLFKNNDDYKSSILNLILDGSRLFFEEGFNDIPEKCMDKTEGMMLERAEEQDPLTLFLNESFVVKEDKKKIERSKFNQCVAKYSKIKFNRNFKSGEINESMRQKGFTEKRIKGNFYFDKIDINMDVFDRWLGDNVNIL